MSVLRVSRLEGFNSIEVGLIDTDKRLFRYLPIYLSRPDAVALSVSLPLRVDVYSEQEFRPYFEGLIPEGSSRRALTAELGVPEDDFLALLEVCGRECIGDVLIEKLSGASEGSLRDIPDIEKTARSGSYKAIDASAIDVLTGSDRQISESNIASRLSLAGTQGKTGLAHLPDADMQSGWFLPVGYAATTHILKTSHMRDIPENEFVCMKAARDCGIEVADAFLLDCRRPVLCVERFDRMVKQVGLGIEVAREHQEDLAQAFGVLPSSKYAELDGGSIRVIADFLKRRSVRPARDLALFTKMLCFSYLIGNCDAHLKNYSIRFLRDGSVGGGISLAPAYDMVCTTVFPRFSRDMAMAFGGVRDIDAVDAQALDCLVTDLGITKGMFKKIAAPIAENLVVSLRAAGSGSLGAVLPSTPYIADEIEEDSFPRIELLRDYCAR